MALMLEPKADKGSNDILIDSQRKKSEFAGDEGLDLDVTEAGVPSKPV